MSSKQFYHDIDLVKVGQLVDARFKNVTNAERATLASTLGAGNVGLAVYDTDDSEMYLWDGTAFKSVSLGVSGDVVFKGVINPTNSDTSNVEAIGGYQYVADTAGTLSKTGVTFSPSAVVEVGDVVLFTSTTTATILQRNVEDATTSQKGQVELATTVETDAGTDSTRAVTPASLTNVLSNISTNASDISTIEGNIGTIGNLTTTATNLVAAIEELQDEIDINTSDIGTIETNIGTIGNLTTIATNLVAAIEELQGEIDTNTTNIGTIGNLTTIATDIVSAIEELQGEIDTNTGDIGTIETNIGTIGNLTTTATNLVGAIEELQGEIDTNTTNIGTNAGDISTLETNQGTIGNLTTTATNLVGAIEELQGEIDTNTSNIDNLDSDLTNLSITQSQISDLSITFSDLDSASVQISTESFTASNTLLMTAAAIEDRITGKGYITGYTVTQGDVTQYSSAIYITESQITDLQSYLIDSNGNNAQAFIDTFVLPTVDGSSSQVLSTDGNGNLSFASVSASETDPVFTSSPAFSIDSDNIVNWDSAYGWGDHSTQGYATIASPTFTGTVTIPGGTIDSTVIGGSSPAAGTFTTVTVSGEITADGLTVDGGGTTDGFTASTPTVPFSAITTITLGSITTGADLKLSYNRSNGMTTLSEGIRGSEVTIQSWNNNGDISFYDSSGTSQSLFWDASTERLGLGTASPSAILDVSGNDASINGLIVGKGSGGVASNTAVGAFALDANTSGLANTAIGYGSLTDNTSGSYHTAAGYAALYFNTTGQRNSAFGTFSLYKNTTGNYNVGHGMYAGYTNETGSSNTSVGYYTGFSNTGSYNTFIGQGAGNACTTGSNNTIIGANAGSAGLSGTIILSAGVTERARCDSSGRWGLGTSSPAYDLEIEGTNKTFQITDAGTNSTLIKLQTSNFTPEVLVQRQGGNPSSIKMVAAGNNSYLQLNNVANKISNIISTGLGDLEFETNSTQRMIILDDGNVGIGTSTPETALHVDYMDPSGTNRTNPVTSMIIETDNNNFPYNGFGGSLLFKNRAYNSGIAQSAAIKSIINNNSVSNNGGSLVFSTSSTVSDSPTDRMVIDYNGYVLVGKSASNSSVVGVEILPQGIGSFTASANQTLYLNRTTSDGAIADFRKDGTTVGSIGTNSGDLTIGTGDCGLLFRDEFDCIQPHNTTTNTTSDGVVSFGKIGARFKDLYLSGGVYLGGTGAANLLDDYEEGTFTPAVSGGTTAGTGTYTSQVGMYTKVGNVVHVDLLLAWTAHTGSGVFVITGLPFTTVNVVGYRAVPSVFHSDIALTAVNTAQGLIINNSSQVLIRQVPVGGGTEGSVPLDTSGLVAISLTYKTAA